MLYIILWSGLIWGIESFSLSQITMQLGRNQGIHNARDSMGLRLNGSRKNTMNEAYTDALQQLNVWRRPEILCFGDAFYDILADEHSAGLSAQEILSHGRWTREPGGESFNVALALAKLGLPTAFAGSLGDDRDGRALARQLRDAGVSLDLVQTVAKPTRRVMVARDHNQEPVFSGFINRLPSSFFADAGFSLQMEDLDLSGYYQNLHWAVSGTIGLAFKDSFRSHMELLRWTQKHHIPLMVDVNWRPQFWNCSSGHYKPGWEDDARRKIQAYCSCADMMKLTAKEATWLTAVPTSEIIQNPGILREFFPSCKGFLVTNGKEDIAFDILGHQGYVHPPIVHQVDEIGAGDAFCAGFLFKIKSLDLVPPLTPSLRNSLTEAVKFGSCVGALATTRVGCIQGHPNFYEAVEMYRRNPGEFRLHFASAFTPHLEDDQSSYYP